MEDHACGADAETLVEQRELVMYPPCGGNPTLRNAHFLKPIFSENHNDLPPPPTSLISSKPTFEKLKKYDLDVYKAYPSEKWKVWVQSLKPTHQEVWKQAGIYEAILASTHTIPRDKELIMGLAERWCAETNTFVFPWGEVTITLEDVMFLGGYSVLGAFYLTPLADECVAIFDCLKNVYHEIRLVSSGPVSYSMWMEYFMCSGKQLEHEAFLAMWLSRFVPVRSHSSITIQDYHVAIHLSRGNRIALAPVVLASIYTDMRLLHDSVVESINLESRGRLRFFLCHADLLHMWVWERFPKLRPTPGVIEREEPRSTRWNGVKILKVRDLRAALDSGNESFLWRPYVITSSDCILSKLYRDDEQWVVVESDATESLARCLRISELVGLDSIEQYLPHRVAMQFGLDQDVPPTVMRSNESHKTVWSTYTRSIRGRQLYIPPRLFQSDVSSRYMIWWRGLLPVNEEMVTTCTQSENHLPAISSTDKCREHRSSTDRPINLGEDAVVSNADHAEVNNVKFKCSKYGVVSKAYCSETEIVNTEEESRDSTTSELLHLGLMNHISRLEKIVDAVKADNNQTEVNNVEVEVAKDEVVSKANCPETKIINIKEESCDDTTSELPHLGMMDRIWRLEKILDAIKAAKLGASSSGYFE